MTQRVTKLQRRDEYGGVEVSVDHISPLYEYLHRHSDFTRPSYRVSKSGPDHQPTYECVWSVRNRDGIFEARASAGKKQVARELAAARLLEVLHLHVPEEPLHKRSDANPPIDTGKNYLGILRTLCEGRVDVSTPTYELRVDSTSGCITCICRVVTRHGLRTVTAIERTKNLARHTAAKLMLDSLVSSLLPDDNPADAFRRLRQLCHRSGWPRPDVQFKPWADSHKTIFKCRVVIGENHRRFVGVGIGISRRAALYAAVVDAVRIITTTSAASLVDLYKTGEHPPLGDMLE